MIDDLHEIKKKYGEKMMHLCRELFPTILEQPGLLITIMSNIFYPSRFLYDDIINNSLIDKFKSYIYTLSNIEEPKVNVNKTPKQLLKNAGYTLYECKTYEDLDKFRKYYAKEEELCTFNERRLDKCYVFFAVKNNANRLRRNDYFTPDRQDEYGTSVISIQFTKGEINTLSIKNRYNHSVKNPDATFSNNLDHIIEGLTESFVKKYNLKLDDLDKYDFRIPGYIMAEDHKFYKVNYEISGITYCCDNIIIEGNKIIKKYQQEKERYILLDYFILDLKEKTLKLYDCMLTDSFIDDFKNINKIEVLKDKDNEEKTIIIESQDKEQIIIKLNKYHQIIEYINPNIKEINHAFLWYNKTMKKIELKNLERTKSAFLNSNIDLVELITPNLVEGGSRFLFANSKIEYIELPKLEKLGNASFYFNKSIKRAKITNLNPDCLDVQAFYNHKKITEYLNNRRIKHKKLVRKIEK